MFAMIMLKWRTGIALKNSSSAGAALASANDISALKTTVAALQSQLAGIISRLINWIDT